MHSQVFSSVFLALCVARGVFAVPMPLKITHDPVSTVDGIPDQEETENLARLKTAETDANRHLNKMEHALNSPTVPVHAEMIDAAFGKDAQIDKIKDSVNKMKEGEMPVKLATHDPADPKFLAHVVYDGRTHPATSGEAQFGKAFHDSQASDNLRASTLVHEASHKLANTGDTVDHDSKMIAGNDFRTKESGRSGYASKLEPAKTPAELNRDKKWTGKRDGNTKYPAIKDMHNNAESYAQFGSMCDTGIPDAACAKRGKNAKLSSTTKAKKNTGLPARSSALKNGKKRKSSLHATSKKSRLPPSKAAARAGARRTKALKKKAAGKATARKPQNKKAAAKATSRKIKALKKNAKPRKSTARMPKKISKSAKAQSSRARGRSSTPKNSRTTTSAKKQGKSSTSRSRAPVQKQSQSSLKRPTSSSKIPRPVAHNSGSKVATVPKAAVANKQQPPSKIPVPVKKVRRDFRL